MIAACPPRSIKLLGDLFQSSGERQNKLFLFGELGLQPRDLLVKSVISFRIGRFTAFEISQVSIVNCLLTYLIGLWSRSGRLVMARVGTLAVSA